MKNGENTQGSVFSVEFIYYCLFLQLQYSKNVTRLRLLIKNIEQTDTQTEYSKGIKLNETNRMQINETTYSPKSREEHNKQEKIQAR